MSAPSAGGRGAAVPALFAEPWQGQGAPDEARRALDEGGQGVPDAGHGVSGEEHGAVDAGHGAPDGAQGLPEGRGVPDEERLARAALTRLVEPGDHAVGRWLRRMGPVALWRALTGKGKPPPGATGDRLAGCALRAAGLDPAADLALIDRRGGRFICPGDVIFHLQSPCCSRSCCLREGSCCGAVAPMLGRGWRYAGAL